MNLLVSDQNSKIKILSTVIVLLISLLGIYKKSFTWGEPNLFELTLIEITAPLQSGVSSTKMKLSDFFKHYLWLVETSKENDEYKKEISQLKNRVFELQSIEKENIRLKELLEFGQDLQSKKVLAQVIAWDSSNEFKLLRINKGSNDGIYEKSPVITADGLVGLVSRVSPNFSDVLTILDSNNRIDAIVDRTRTHGVIQGTGNYQCSMKYVSRNEPVQEGDILITAGLGMIYPKGIKIGNIGKIVKGSFDLTQRIEVNPAVEFFRLEEVVVLIPLDGEGISHE